MECLLFRCHLKVINLINGTMLQRSMTVSPFVQHSPGKEYVNRNHADNWGNPRRDTRPAFAKATPKAFASRRRDKRVTGNPGKRRTPNVQHPMWKSLRAEAIAGVSVSQSPLGRVPLPGKRLTIT